MWHNTDRIMWLITSEGESEFCWRLEYAGNGLKFGWFEWKEKFKTEIVYTWKPNIDIWYHVAIVKYQQMLKIFVGGKQKSVTTTLQPIIKNLNTKLVIGKQIYSNSYFHGCMDQIRITKWKALRH